MPAFEIVAPDLFLWRDTCNVYVVRHGTSALLIDLGDGSVLDHLSEIQVTQVEYILFTHHHREQCQGGIRLRNTVIKTACHEKERPFFENPLSFRQMRPTLNDPFSVYGASYVRPPMLPIKIDLGFQSMDVFQWKGREFRCVETQGNSPGHMAYLLEINSRWWVFSGDLMLDGARWHTWFDTEWDYGFAKGLYELGKSAAQIAQYHPEKLLPGHGPIIPNPQPMLVEYVRKLRALAPLYVRGYDIQKFDNCDQDNVSEPSPVPHLWKVSPHLYKFRGPNYWVNFAMILSENGHALFVDCGLFDRGFLDRTIQSMKDRLGLKQIDAIFVTHMHGDHALDADYVRKKYGAALWTMAGIADKFEKPWDFDYAALLPAYTDRGKQVGALKFDRVLAEGEVIRWQKFTFAVDWMPGQTKFHACLQGEIDGQRVAFTGDNLFASSTDPQQGGNEAVVARNACILEEGYLYAADYLHGIGPDLLVGGHCWLMANPMPLIRRYRERMLKLRDALQELSGTTDYRYAFDPYWVRAEPYRTSLLPGTSKSVQIVVRNFQKRIQSHRVSISPPGGIRAIGGVWEGTVGPESEARKSIEISVADEVRSGLHLLPLDITLDG